MSWESVVIDDFDFFGPSHEKIYFWKPQNFRSAALKGRGLGNLRF